MSVGAFAVVALLVCCGIWLTALMFMLGVTVGKMQTRIEYRHREEYLKKHPILLLHKKEKKTDKK